MSGISLCDTCSNCECIFQTGIVREQCEFYIEKNEYCRAIDDVLEIIDEISDSTCITFGTMTHSDGKGELRNRVLALKGEQE